MSGMSRAVPCGQWRLIVISAIALTNVHKKSLIGLLFSGPGFESLNPENGQSGAIDHDLTFYNPPVDITEGLILVPLDL
jgi:hypothetical protein